jgi:hypothetical protein
MDEKTDCKEHNTHEEIMNFVVIQKWLVRDLTETLLISCINSAEDILSEGNNSK